MTPQDVMYITVCIRIYNGETMKSYHSARKNENFECHGYKFVYDNGEYTAYKGNLVFKCAYEFLLYDDEKHFSNKTYVSNLINIIHNNDIETFIKRAVLEKGSIFIFNTFKNEYVRHAPTDWYDTITLLIDNKVPFRYIDHDENENIYHFNSISGEYKLYDPFENYTQADINNTKIFEILSLI